MKIDGYNLMEDMFFHNKKDIFEEINKLGDIQISEDSCEFEGVSINYIEDADAIFITGTRIDPDNITVPKFILISITIITGIDNFSDNIYVLRRCNCNDFERIWFMTSVNNDLGYFQTSQLAKSYANRMYPQYKMLWKDDDIILHNDTYLKVYRCNIK